MNVLRMAENKLKIFLTDSEVKSNFGDYEHLYYMSEKGKTVMSALLKDIIFKNYMLNGKEIFKTKIKVHRNSGCEITVYLVRNQASEASEMLVVTFNREQDLNRLLNIFLKTKNRFFEEAELCKINGKYILVMNKTDENSSHALNEFCHFKTNDKVFYEFIKEHGKSLLKGSELEKYAKDLIKDP